MMMMIMVMIMVTIGHLLCLHDVKLLSLIEEGELNGASSSIHRRGASVSAMANAKDGGRAGPQDHDQRVAAEENAEQTPTRLVFDKPYGFHGTSKGRLPPGGSHLARDPAEE